MSYGRPYINRYTSPFSSSAYQAPPIVSDSDYQYVSGEGDISRRGEDTRRGYSLSSDEQPDIIYVLHRNRRVTLDFPPFSIAEGHLKIRTIRGYAADKLDFDPRRLKLQYKGKTLRDDQMSARDAGLKQLSELTCVHTEGEYEDSDSENEYAARRISSNYGGSTSGGGAAAGGRYSGPSTPSRSGFPSSAVNTSSSATSAPRPTAVPTTTASATSSADGSRASPAPVKLDPYKPPPESTSAREKIQHCMSFFRSNYLPQCQMFLDNPPKDPVVRKKEALRLGETVFGQIQNRLDNIETDGYEAVRAMRKAAIKEVLEVITKLDQFKDAAR